MLQLRHHYVVAASIGARGVRHEVGKRALVGSAHVGSTLIALVLAEH